MKRFPDPRAAGIVAVLAVAGCGPTRGATILPSGTYVYEALDGANASAFGTVTIARDATAIVVRDDGNIGGTAISAIRRLDPSSFSVVSYQVVGDSDDSIAIANDGATFHLRGGKTATLPPRVLNVPSTVFDFLPSSVVLLPAMLHASGRTKIDQYGLDVMSSQPTAGYLAAVPSNAPRPSAVPASDVSIGIADNGGDVTTIWYDPVTFVVSAFATHGLTVRLKPDAAAGEIHR